MTGNLPALTQLASSGVGAVGSVVGGFGGKAAADYNARVALAQADSERGAASIEANRALQRGLYAEGSLRARMAAGGADITTGSPLLALLDATMAAHEDAQMVRARGDFAAWGHEAEAANQKWMGTQTMLAGFMKAGNALTAGGGTSLIDAEKRRKRIGSEQPKMSGSLPWKGDSLESLA